MKKEYLDKLTDALAKHGLDAILIAPSDDMRYLLGANPILCARFQGLFIKRDGSSFYVCNVLSRDEMRQFLEDDIKVYCWWDHEGFIGTTRTALEENGLIGAKIGVSVSVRAFNVLTIAEHIDVTFTDGRIALEQVRILKTPAQMQDLRDAAAIADCAFEKIKGDLRPGLSEKEIADKLVSYMTDEGGTAAMALVCAGDNGAYPHYFGNSRIVKYGDPILFDFGCQYGEMRSDSSRTVFIGEASAHQRKIYEIVLRAQIAAEATAVKGAYVPDIDRTARDIIKSAGYGEYFLTRTGHGIGAAMHEGPYITQTSDVYLEEGMAFSIEPGIYIAGDIGVRIEDVLLIGPGGTEVLNKTNKTLTVIPCDKAEGRVI